MPYTARLHEADEHLAILDDDGDEVASGIVPASQEWEPARYDAELARVAASGTLRPMPFRRVGEWDRVTLSCAVEPVG